MARETTHNLSVTPDEFVWIQRNVCKRAALVPADTKNRELKELVKLSERLSEPSSVVLLNRKQARILQTLLINTINTLQETVIPGYQDKGLKDYLRAAEAKTEHARVLLEKVGKVL